jgi:hypothetical protein
MNVLQFRKRTEALNTLQQRTGTTNLGIRRGTPGVYSKRHDDFSREIEMTRAQTALMAVLKARALEPATISLHDIKKKIDFDC